MAQAKKPTAGKKPPKKSVPAKRGAAKAKPKPKRAGNRFFRLRNFVFLGVLALLCVWIFDLQEVASPSMMPSLVEGDLVLVERLSVEFCTPEAGDVVLVRNPDARERELMVRVVGVARDVVQVRDGEVFVNGDSVVVGPTALAWSESYAPPAAEGEVPSNVRVLRADVPSGQRHSLLQRSDSLASSKQNQELVVPDGHLFVVGDNHAGAYDSRAFGALPVADVMGNVLVVVRTEDDGGGWFGRWIHLIP